ncbi:MAG: transposase [Candidatus Tectimicrobiota bacterium]
MLTLPTTLVPVIGTCAPLFSKPVWEHAKVLLIGAILTAGNRTVTACLRGMGLGQEKHFVNDHRVVNRARWSAMAASHLLLSLLVTTFAPHGELIFGLDDTIERRRGEHIKAKGIYRDPVRSSHAHVVKASGVRWLCCMLFVQVSWAETIWGLPVLTALCPSERYHTARGRPHQTLTAKAWPVIQVVRRWLPTRPLVCVTESSFAVLDVLGAVSRTAGVSLMTRWRLDAELWAPVPDRPGGQRGRPRVQGARRPSPQQRLDDAKTVWTTLTIEGWYGGGIREVEVYSETCLWYKSGHQPS